MSKNRCLASFTSIQTVGVLINKLFGGPKSLSARNLTDKYFFADRT